MHLEQHARARSLFRERRVDADHRDLDDVGGGALDGRVGGRAFAELPDVPVGRAQFGDVAAPSGERLDEAVGLRLLDLFVEVFAHAGQPLEVLRDEGLRLRRADAQLLRERERSDPVDGREVDGLGGRPHLGR